MLIKNIINFNKNRFLLELVFSWWSLKHHNVQILQYHLIKLVSGYWVRCCLFVDCRRTLSLSRIDCLNKPCHCVHTMSGIANCILITSITEVRRYLHDNTTRDIKPQTPQTMPSNQTQTSGTDGRSMYKFSHFVSSLQWSWLLCHVRSDVHNRRFVLAQHLFLRQKFLRILDNPKELYDPTATGTN